MYSILQYCNLYGGEAVHYVKSSAHNVKLYYSTSTQHFVLVIYSLPTLFPGYLFMKNMVVDRQSTSTANIWPHHDTCLLPGFHGHGKSLKILEK